MGLDQYAYVTANAGDREKFWEDAELDTNTKEFVNPSMNNPREIAYWRKHPNLQGWMENLWESKGCPGDDDRHFLFNGIELELTYEDILQLEQDILHNKLAQLETNGFFYGDASDDYYRDQDLEFVKHAKAELFCGLKVFYNSSW
jgi:hypothetical protein